MTATMTPAHVAELRAFYASGRVTQAALAARYGTGQSHVSAIIRGESWNGTSQRASLSERFWRHVEKRAAEECWPWTGARNPGGYGVIGRVALEIDRGPIPARLHVDHLCRNRICVNPTHLEAVTQAENNRRAWVTRSRRGVA